jgi:hypothetical protein
MSVRDEAERHEPSLSFGSRVLLVLLLVLALLYVVATGTDPLSAALELPFAAVGAVLVVRRPRNAIGWLLLLGAALGILSAPQVQGPAGPLVSGTAPLAERAFAWLANETGIPIFSCYALLAVIFPSGRLPAGRWGRAVRVLIVANAVALVVSAIRPSISVSLADGSTINAANPFALLPPSSEGVVSTPGQIIVLGTLLLAVGSIVIRLWRAKGLERLQLRWLVASLVLSCVGVLIALMSGLWALAFLVFTTIPLAIGIAILRYRLYEIDRLISRTLAYGLVTVVLLAIFGGAILVLQTLLSPLTGGNTLAVAGSTLLAAALFQPLRRRVQALVDRRFNRSRYDAQAAVAAFTERLRDEVDIDTLQGSLLSIVEATLEPTTSGLWLRES